MKRILSFGLLAVGVFLLVPLSLSAQGTAADQAAELNDPPVVKPIHANLVPPTTTFTVEATDPDGDPLTYTWDANISCGIFRGLANKPSATWTHPEGELPLGCHHEDGTSHVGTIYVHIDDGHHSVLCSYNGSESGDGPECLKDAPEYYPGIFEDWEDFVYEYCYYFLWPLVLLLCGGAWWFYKNDLFVNKEADVDPCAELRKAEEAARARYEAARQAFSDIDVAKKAADDAAKKARDARSAADAAARAAGGRWSAHGSTDWEGEHIEVHKEGWQNKELGKKADDAGKAANDASDAAKQAKADFDGKGGSSAWQRAKQECDTAKAAWEKAAAALKVCIGGIGAPKPEPKPEAPKNDGGGTPPGGGGGGHTTPTGPVTTDSGSSTGGGTTPPPQKKEEPRFVCNDGDKRNERTESIDVSILDLPSVVLKQDKIYSDAGNEAMKFVDYLQTIKDLFMLGKKVKGGAEAYLEKSITGGADAVGLPDFFEWYDRGIDNLTKSMHQLYAIMQDKQRLGDYWLEYRIKKLTLTCKRWDVCSHNAWVSRCELSVEDKGFETHTTNPEQVLDVREVQRAINRLFTMLRNRYNGDKTRAEQFTRTCR